MEADLYESKPGRAVCVQEIFFVIFIVPKMLRAAKRLTICVSGFRSSHKMGAPADVSICAALLLPLGR